MVQTRQFLIYAAGPIAGLTWKECTEWRNDLRYLLPSHITVMSPLRAKTYLSDEDKVAHSYEEYPLSSQRGLFVRDRFDVERCDLLLSNFLGAKTVSIGSCMEIAWAHLLHKPIIVVMEKDNMHQHPFIKECAGYIVDDLEVAANLATVILTPEIIP